MSLLSIGETWDGTALAAWQNQCAPADAIGPRAVSTTVDERPCVALTAFSIDVAPLTPTANPRAQLLSPPLIEQGGTYKETVALKVPAGALPAQFPASSWGMTLLQCCYGPPFNGSGPLGLATGDAKTLRFQHGTQAWTTPLVRETWLTFEFDFLMSTAGWVQVAYGQGDAAPQIVLPKTACATVTPANNSGACNMYLDTYMAAGTSDRVGPILFSGATLTRTA